MQSSLFQASAVPLRLRALRGRQIGVIPQIAQAVREGHRMIMVQAPCGFGKTVLSAHLMNSSVDKGKRPLFVAPAISLVEQTLESFEAQGIRDIGIIQAQHERTDWMARIQIASRDTLVRRHPSEVDLVTVDEAHDRRAALDELLMKWRDEGKVIIGLSATPWSKGLGLLWTKLIIAATMKDMLADGAPTGLCPFDVYGVADSFEPNTTGIKTINGDFDEKQSSALMNTEVLVGNAVEHWMKHRQIGNHPGNRTFLRGVDRAHATSLMEAFNAAGVRCGYIDGNSDREQRRQIFAKYRTYEFEVLASVRVLGVGVDEDVRCLVDCAITKSEINHVQWWGRLIRLAEGKTLGLGLDHGGNCTRLGMPQDIHHDTLDGRQPGDKGEAYAEDGEAPKPRKCQKCQKVIPAKTRSCPACGDVYVPQNKTEHVAGELVKLAPKVKVNREHQDWYSELMWISRKSGFKRGWASHTFEERWGVKPVGLKDRGKSPTDAVKKFVSDKRKRYLESTKKVSA